MKNSRLIIEDIKATPVLAPLARPIITANITIPAAPLILIDVICSNGVTGKSYLFGYTPLSLHPIVDLLGSLSELVRGKEVAPYTLKMELDNKFRLLGRQGLLGMAMAGVDMACWDALGRAAGLSVAKMLGGSEDPIICYDSHGVFNAQTSSKDLEQSLHLGFKAVKVKIGGGELQEDIDAVKSIRNIIGEDTKLMVDYNQSLDVPEAIRRIRYLSEFDLHWVEEPVLAEDFFGHNRVRDASNVAIQTGENWWFPEDAARAVKANVSDFAMLDIMKIGGVTGWMQAAAIVNGASLPISSHIFIEASSHVMSATPGAHMLEYLDVASAVLADPLEIQDGTLKPRGPGLGIEWNESAVEKYLV